MSDKRVQSERKVEESLIKKKYFYAIMFSKVFYAPQGCIYLFKNTIKAVILLNIITILNNCFLLIYFKVEFIPVMATVNFQQ